MRVGNGPGVVASETRKPWWLIPNLLSLDAPLVAIAWLWVFAKTWRLGYHQWEAYAVLGMAVWLIYAADRLFDVAMASGSGIPVEERHRFHERFKSIFIRLIWAVFVATTALVLLRMPIVIYNYLLLGAVLVAGFYGLSMIQQSEKSEIPLAKNIMAGFTFAYGTAMMAHLFRQEYGIGDMLLSREFLSFAALCTVNISAIDMWEHAARSTDSETRASDELALTLALGLLGGAALLFALLDNSQATRPFYYSILSAAALIYVLNRNRDKLGTRLLRVLADLAMLVPVLVFKAASGL